MLQVNRKYELSEVKHEQANANNRKGGKTGE